MSITNALNQTCIFTFNYDELGKVTSYINPGQGKYKISYKINKNTPSLTKIIEDGKNVPLK